VLKSEKPIFSHVPDTVSLDSATAHRGVLNSGHPQMGVGSMERRAVPRNVERSLYQEAESKCPKCGEANVMALTIHHIIAYAEACVHDPDAMIVLCANCHAKADRREITEDELFQIKRALRAKQVTFAARVPEVHAASSPSINIGHQDATHIINIAGNGTTVMPPKARRTRVVVAPQPGSISDTQLREIND
jgi:hypothetical protein